MHATAHQPDADLAQALGINEADLEVLLLRQAARRRKMRRIAGSVLALGLMVGAVTADYAAQYTRAPDGFTGAQYVAVWQGRIGLAPGAASGTAPTDAAQNDTAQTAPRSRPAPAAPAQARPETPAKPASRADSSGGGLASLVSRITGSGAAGDAAAQTTDAQAAQAETGAGSGLFGKLFGSGDKSAPSQQEARAGSRPAGTGDPKAAVKINRAPADGCGAGNFCKVD